MTIQHITREQYEARVRWRDALLSGDYKQGRDVLHTARASGDTFCCLGVACQAQVTGVNIERTAGPGAIFQYDGRGSVAPPSVQAALGISELGHMGAIGSSLAALNDGGASFEAIAAVITEHLIDPYEGWFR